MYFLDQPSFQNNKIRIIVIDQEIKKNVTVWKKSNEVMQNQKIRYLRFQLIHKNTLIECKTLNSKEMFKLVNIYNLLAGDIVFFAKKVKLYEMMRMRLLRDIMIAWGQCTSHGRGPRFRRLLALF